MVDLSGGAFLVFGGAVIGAAIVGVGYVLLRHRSRLRSASSEARKLGVDVWRETRRVGRRYAPSFLGGVVGALIAGLTIQSLNGWSLDRAAARLELERAMLANSGVRVLEGPGRMGYVLVLSGLGDNLEVVPCPPNWESAAEAADRCLVLGGGGQ